MKYRLQAVFCFSDMIAVGFISAVQEAGLRIPEDVAVVCFDGTAAARYSSPPITAIAQPEAQMSAAAVSAMMSPSPVGEDHHVFAPQLIEGASCCSPVSL